jgi:hypothetical protein
MKQMAGRVFQTAALAACGLCNSLLQYLQPDKYLFSNFVTLLHSPLGQAIAALLAYASEVRKVGH